MDLREFIRPVCDTVDSEAPATPTESPRPACFCRCCLPLAPCPTTCPSSRCSPRHSSMEQFLFAGPESFLTRQIFPNALLKHLALASLFPNLETCSSSFLVSSSHTSRPCRSASKALSGLAVPAFRALASFALDQAELAFICIPGPNFEELSFYCVAGGIARLEDDSVLLA